VEVFLPASTRGIPGIEFLFSVVPKVAAGVYSVCCSVGIWVLFIGVDRGSMKVTVQLNPEYVDMSIHPPIYISELVLFNKDRSKYK
jgi:hypothetical protein